MHRGWRKHVLGRLERELALLGDTDEYHALGQREAGSIASSDGVLALPALELNDRYQLLVGEGGNGLDELIVEWADGGRRGDPIAEVIAQEAAQLAARLQLGHVAVEIQAVDAVDLERDVVAK